MNLSLTSAAGMLTGLFLSRFAVLQIRKEMEYKEKNRIYIIILNVVLWDLLYLNCGMTWEYLIFALVASALLGLSAVDLACYEIPIEFNIFILLLGLVQTYLDRENWLSHVLGFFLVSGIFLVISLVTKGKGMGGGDIKLMATLGLVLGAERILLVMVVGSVLGAVIHSIIMKVRKKEHMLAFGPYLAAAGIIAMCWGNELIQYYLSFFPNVD